VRHSANNGVDRQKIRLLSFNIQAGTSTARYHHYVTHSWRQVLPHTQRVENLDAIAELVAPYDMVALQEVDSGSLRSGFINQSRYLANHAGMPFWCHQSNRKVGTVAYAGNGFLSKFEPDSVEEFRLPGIIPGRGTLLIHYGKGQSGLDVAVVHLALGKRARGQQLKFLAERLQDSANLIVMGDLNTQVDTPQILEFRDELNLLAPTRGLASFPSWQPQRAIDHILISRHLGSVEAGVLDATNSDHCPVSLEINLPPEIHLQPATRSIISVEVS
jgi:endonuclease/exonuclease/phosphatase family metal-dependent hydrolase